MSDNDRVAIYDQSALAELVWNEKDNISLDDFKIDLGNPISLKELLGEISSLADEKEYDENMKTENKCPKCGYEW